MIPREITSVLEALAKQYPVITIVGPRQAGKTTLARLVFHQHTYVNLELPDIRQMAMQDPRAFLQQYQSPVIIDEIQRVPELLSYIQAIVDEENSNGRFILTGSNQLQLNESINQSLAGRTAIFKLWPLTISELKNAGISLSRDQYLTRGFLPRIHDQNQDPYRSYGNYLETYVERDLRQQINLRNLSHFQTFLKLLAGRVGQLLNLNSLSNDVGVSSTTLSQWLSILETSFIIFRLQPYYENFGKRLIKTPKVYFTEVGLACYLLGIESPNTASRDPLIGGLFENMVIADILKTRYNQGLPGKLYFFRDSHGHEVDLLYEHQRTLVPIEIKSAMTYQRRMDEGITHFQKFSPKASKGYIIYAGDPEFDQEKVGLRHFTHIRDIFI